MITYRASELGGCTRMLVAKRLGMGEAPTPAWQQRVYDVGNTHEPACVAAMEADDWHFLPRDIPDYDWDDGQIYVDLSVGAANITGHLDGIAYQYHGPEREGFEFSDFKVVEIKAPGAWAKFEKAYKTADWSDPLARRYAWQISCYMVATGLEAVVACLDEGGVHTFGIEVPPFGLGAITARVLELEAHAASGALPDDPGYCNQSFCPFPYLHDAGPEETEDEVLDGYASEYEVGRLMESDGKKIKESARDAMMAYGGGLTPNWKVTISEVDGRKSLDEKAMKADGIDVEKYRKVGAPSKRLSVTKRDPFED